MGDLQTYKCLPAPAQTAKHQRMHMLCKMLRATLLITCTGVGDSPRRWSCALPFAPAPPAHSPASAACACASAAASPPPASAPSLSPCPLVAVRRAASQAAWRKRPHFETCQRMRETTATMQNNHDPPGCCGRNRVPVRLGGCARRPHYQRNHACRQIEEDPPVTERPRERKAMRPRARQNPRDTAQSNLALSHRTFTELTCVCPK